MFEITSPSFKFQGVHAQTILSPLVDQPSHSSWPGKSPLYCLQKLPFAFLLGKTRLCALFHVTS